MKKVIFACVHGAGRSQMAAAFFNALAAPEKARAIAAGTEPASRVHAEVVDAMADVGIDLSRMTPRLLDPDLASDAAMLVTLGCGEKCPAVTGAAREDWPLPDPKGLPADAVAAVRDEIRDRVEALLEAKGWAR
jgi:arsenate reductase